VPDGVRGQRAVCCVDLRQTWHQGAIAALLSEELSPRTCTQQLLRLGNQRWSGAAASAVIPVAAASLAWVTGVA